ncbi:unnamed protein product [Symbiodinium sp. CCMP2456]|nr:unnamed protein product [Symbiodinium sp. CCMP2456]
MGAQPSSSPKGGGGHGNAGVVRQCANEGSPKWQASASEKEVRPARRCLPLAWTGAGEASDEEEADDPAPVRSKTLSAEAWEARPFSRDSTASTLSAGKYRDEFGAWRPQTCSSRPSLPSTASASSSARRPSRSTCSRSDSFRSSATHSSHKRQEASRSLDPDCSQPGANSRELALNDVKLEDARQRASKSLEALQAKLRASRMPEIPRQAEVLAAVAEDQPGQIQEPLESVVRIRPAWSEKQRGAYAERDEGTASTALRTAGEDISAVKTVSGLPPPMHTVKLLPSEEISRTQRTRRARLAVWLYGSATGLTLLCLKGRQLCRPNRGRKSSTVSLQSGERQPLMENDGAKAEEDVEAVQKNDVNDELVQYQLAVGFVMYHMTYTFSGFILVFWACRQGYLNKYGLDWELYLFWFLESVVTHLICGATPGQFLRSIMPIFSERYDLIKDTVSIGVYANLNNLVGHICAAIIVVTMLLPNMINYLDPVTARLSRIAYWPQQQNLSVKKASARSISDMLTVLAQQTEEATRGHRRMLCLFEDLPQLFVAVGFSVYTFYAEGAGIPPFIAVNMVVAFVKTCSILFGRPFVLAWMALHDVPWPASSIAERDVRGVVSVGVLGEEWKQQAFEELLGDSRAPISSRQAAEEELFKLFLGFMGQGASDMDFVKHARWQHTFDCVTLLALSKELSDKQADALVRKWEVMNDIQFLCPESRRESLVSLRSIAENAEKEPDGSFVAATWPRPLLGLLWLHFWSSAEDTGRDLAIYMTQSTMDEATARKILSFGPPAMIVAPWEDFQEEAGLLVRLAFSDEDFQAQGRTWSGRSLLRASGKLFESQQDSVLQEACYAVQWLGESTLKLYRQNLLELLSHQERGVQNAAFRALFYWGQIDDALNAMTGSAADNLHRWDWQSIKLAPACIGMALTASHAESLLAVVLLAEASDFQSPSVYGLLSQGDEQCDSFVQKKLAEMVLAGRMDKAKLLARAIQSPSAECFDVLVQLVKQAHSPISRGPEDFSMFDAVQLLQRWAGKLTGGQIQDLVKELWASGDNAFQDTFPYGVCSVLQALVNTPEAVACIPRLVEIARGQGRPEVQEAVCMVLHRFGTVPDMLPQLGELAYLLRDSHSRTRRAACHVFESQDAIPLLAKYVPMLLSVALEDVDQNVREAAWSALVRLDVVSNGLTDSEARQRVSSVANGLDTHEKELGSRALADACCAACLIPADEVSQGIVEALSRLATVRIDGDLVIGNKEVEAKQKTKLMARTALCQLRRHDAIAEAVVANPTEVDTWTWTLMRIESVTAAQLAEAAPFLFRYAAKEDIIISRNALERQAKEAAVKKLRSGKSPAEHPSFLSYLAAAGASGYDRDGREVEWVLGDDALRKLRIHRF